MWSLEEHAVIGMNSHMHGGGNCKIHWFSGKSFPFGSALESQTALMQEVVGRQGRIQKLQSRLQGTSTANANRWQRLQVRLLSP